MHYFGAGAATGLGPAAIGLIGLAIVWSIVWKGFALWRAARRGDKVWFIVFLVVNTIGILEIIYLFLVTKPEGAGAPTPQE